jgi:single-strand DNA-binding protein
MFGVKNRVQLIGRLGADPVVKTLSNGSKMAKFSLATNDHYKNADGDMVEEVQWHQLVAFGKLAGLVEKFLVKGTEVSVEGKLTNRSYVDKDGVRKHHTEIELVELLRLAEKKAV